MKQKRGCEIRGESGKLDLNAGDEERFEPQRYKANPWKYFWKSILKELKKKQNGCL